MTTTTQESITALRKQLRKKRKSLQSDFKRKSANQIARRLNTVPEFSKVKRVGVYLDAFGEVPTAQIIRYARCRKKLVYLPIILPSQRAMRFGKFIYPANTKHLRTHKLGMKSMHASQHIKVDKLDLLIMPLVAADMHGNRLGMGGGFYDRTLSKTKKRPTRVGLAYDFQVVNKLETQPWDEPLDYLLTPTKIFRF